MFDPAIRAILEDIGILVIAPLVTPVWEARLITRGCCGVSEACGKMYAWTENLSLFK